jgi:hypothetical protein
LGPSLPPGKKNTHPPEPPLTHPYTHKHRYTALATAAYHPELVQACAVLNGAGSFDPEIPPDALKEMTTTQTQKPKKEKDFLDTLKDKAGQAVRRVLMYSAFYYTKQPGKNRVCLCV